MVGFPLRLSNLNYHKPVGFLIKKPTSVFNDVVIIRTSYIPINYGQISVLKSIDKKKMSKVSKKGVINHLITKIRIFYV